MHKDRHRPATSLPAAPPTARPATMPPPLAHTLTPGFNTPLRYIRSKARSSAIGRMAYPPYERLYAFLRPFGLPSLRAISARAELPYALVSKVMRGRTEPHFYQGIAIARAIGCDAFALDAYLTDVQRHPLRIEDWATQQAKADTATAWKGDMTQPTPTPQPRVDDPP